MQSKFPVPNSLQDLERGPFNLLPYPLGFNDIDEATRAESFEDLLTVLENGNNVLKNGGMLLFDDEDANEGFAEWNDIERIQALYTLVRKSSSLAPSTRMKLVTTIVTSLKSLSSILLQSYAIDKQSGTVRDNSAVNANSGKVVSQSFRDAFACHIYMLYSVMFIIESDLKAGKNVSAAIVSKGKSGKKKGESTRKGKENSNDSENIASMRDHCMETMHIVTQSMTKCSPILWSRAVPDESVIGLPSRIAYLILETAITSQSRKSSFTSHALNIIAISLDSDDRLFGTGIAVLFDFLHSYEHAASLVADLCCLVKETPVNKLALELLREIGRIDNSNISSSVETEGKASGVKNVAPFILELAERKPRLVFEYIDLLLPHLNSDPYYFRSSIISAIGLILTKSDLEREATNDDCESEWVSDEASSKKQKESELTLKLLNILITRARDVNSFVRAAVMKSLAHLIEKQSLPLERLVAVTNLAIDRLQDRTVIVRRCSMQVLTLLLKENPFMDSLNGEKYRVKEIELKSFLLENAPEALKAARLEAVQSLDQGSESYKGSLAEIDSAFYKAIIESVNSSDADGSGSLSDWNSKVQAYKFVDSALSFINLFETADETFRNLLLSSNTSDVVEALRFFVQANHFHMPFAIRGMREALTLMWSSDVNIHEEVLNAFLDVFITVPGTDRKEYLPSKKIAQNLLILVSKANASESASIEEAISRLVKKEMIPSEVFSILWSIAAKSPSRYARAAAMLIISMGGSADSSIVDSASRLRHLLEAGLGDYTEEHRDWATAKAAATALQRVKLAPSDCQSAKFLVSQLIIERLQLVIRGTWCQDDIVDDTNLWFGAAEQAINALFVLSPQPEKSCKEVIRSMESSTFGFGGGRPRSSCHSLQLSRFFFVVSHIALKLLVYTEALSGSVRRANAAKATSNHEETVKARNAKSADDAHETANSIESELGITQAEEAEAELKVAEISEKEIVGRGIIGLFAPLVVRVVATGAYQSDVLMQSSTLALCKFMCISSTFCSKYLPLLFKTLSNAPSDDVTLRANIVIALGDLAFRFPNEFEPYTSHLYGCLRDKSTRVRRHGLMVLTHLILNDMIKCKGQICEIALCICEDKEAPIRDMAKLLFHELSKRSNNPIYNLLPDIISRLSMIGVKKDDFRRIMAFLFNFIKKDKQNETLVEKLCQRFSKCSSISEIGDISYCLAQLKINEKCVKILLDQFKSYKDALFDEDVYKNFASIVTKVKKLPAFESKEVLVEWESRLKEQRCA